jgi:hypothetical protein
VPIVEFGYVFLYVLINEYVAAFRFRNPLVPGVDVGVAFSQGDSGFRL